MEAFTARNSLSVSTVIPEFILFPLGLEKKNRLSKYVANATRESMRISLPFMFTPPCVHPNVTQWNIGPISQ